MIYGDRNMLLPAIETIHEAYHIGFPGDEAVRLNQLSQGLFHQSNGKFDGIDIMVFAVRTPCPFMIEVDKRRD
jgi:hypothetical protein